MQSINLPLLNDQLLTNHKIVVLCLNHRQLKFDVTQKKQTKTNKQFYLEGLSMFYSIIKCNHSTSDSGRSTWYIFSYQIKFVNGYKFN